MGAELDPLQPVEEVAGPGPERAPPLRWTPEPASPAVSAVLALQRSAGNVAVRRYLARFVHGVATPTYHGSRQRPMLRPGDVGPDVVELQEKLNAAGAAPPLAVSGNFDGSTRRQVVRFQGDNGLETDAIVGPLTWGALDRITGTPELPVGPDQHAGVHRPTAGEQKKIGELLFPARGQDQPWDGAGNTPEALSNRETLKLNMWLAMRVALDDISEKVDKWAAADRMPIEKLEPAGKEAKRLTDEKFEPLVGAAARTTSQEEGLAAFDYAAGVNLFDAADTKARKPDALQAAVFIALSEPSCKDLVRQHHLDRSRSTPEEDFFFDEICKPFADAHKPPLEKFNRFGFSTPQEGKVFAQTTLDDPLFPNKETVKGEPPPAHRHLQWKMLRTLVHEYIHLLEHPATVQARGGNDVLREGFCEMFTEEVVAPAIAAAKGGDARIRIAVEGGDYPKGFSPSLIPDYAPAKQYAEFVRSAKGVRDALGAGGPAAVKAAFFQGHVELIGLTPDGKLATPASAGDEDLVKVPPVVHTPFALAVMTGSSPEAIVAANPKLRPDGPLPKLVHVPGCRYHKVVEAVESKPGPGAAAARQAETTEQVATQNGVTVGDLERANPGLNRRVPVAGEELLVPVHT